MVGRIKHLIVEEPERLFWRFLAAMVLVALMAMLF